MGKPKEENPKLKEYGIHADSHWKEIMRMAQDYGFIVQAYGGTAVLATHQNQLEVYGEKEYLRIQSMNGHCPKTFGYDGCLGDDGHIQACGSCWYINKKTPTAHSH